MSESKATRDDLTILQTLLLYALVGMPVAGLTLYLTPNVIIACAVGIATAFAVSLKLAGRLTGNIGLVAAVAAAGVAYLEFFPSAKDCKSMMSTVDFLADEQYKSTEYWGRCANPIPEDRGWCSDFKPEKSQQTLHDEREYLIERISLRCSAKTSRSGI